MMEKHLKEAERAEQPGSCGHSLAERLPCPVCVCPSRHEHAVSKVAPSAEYPYELRTVTTCEDCGGVWEGAGRGAPVPAEPKGTADDEAGAP